MRRALDADWRDVPLFGRPPAVGQAVVRPSAYALLGDELGRVAVVGTPQGLLLLGGGMEAGESPESTVVREAREECGLVLAVGEWRRRAVELIYSAAERTHFEKRSTFVDAFVVAPRVTPMETDHELMWMEPDAAIAHMWHESHRWAIAEWRRHG